MKYLFVIVLFCNIFYIHAQETGGTELLSHKTYEYPSTAAQPVGGLDIFYSEFAQKFDFTRLSEPDNTEAICTLQFFVEKDGSFTDILVKKDVYGAGKEAVRVLKTMPKWQPALENGEVVRSKYQLHLNLKKPLTK